MARHMGYKYNASIYFFSQSTLFGKVTFGGIIVPLRHKTTDPALV